MDEDDRESSQDAINDAEWQNPANWRWVLFYYSERDSRPWVPKRSLYRRHRYGSTPNFANQTARNTLITIAGVMVIIFLTVVWLERLGMLR